ncbi:hypothetical protein F7725_011556 [Dissostichus mawsoni]|uniref:Uncharacterized protein n=1 Tax=Dissostichus mawsoni TaxID=36200 RepID=A0A7J5Z9E9_DISMA|nr:hypothetical protein F7725_011556 [Dissostichus mawsoni]
MHGPRKNLGSASASCSSSLTFSFWHGGVTVTMSTILSSASSGSVFSRACICSSRSTSSSQLLRVVGHSAERVGTGAVAGGDGAAVTAVPAPGSVFTVEEERHSGKAKYWMNSGGEMKPGEEDRMVENGGGNNGEGGEWGRIPLTLCQRQGKGGGRLSARTWGGSSCSRVAPVFPPAAAIPVTSEAALTNDLPLLLGTPPTVPAPAPLDMLTTGMLVMPLATVTKAPVEPAALFVMVAEFPAPLTSEATTALDRLPPAAAAAAALALLAALITAA